MGLLDYLEDKSLEERKELDGSSKIEQELNSIIDAGSKSRESSVIARIMKKPPVRLVQNDITGLNPDDFEEPEEKKNGFMDMLGLL